MAVPVAARLLARIAAAVPASAVAVALAQPLQTAPPLTKLREPSRTVYRCEVDGKVSYSDAPCAGARRVDVEPSRGFNKSTGRELTGADVRRELHNEAFAEAIRPITGKDAKGLEVDRRRMRLSPAARAECATLDRRVAKGEADEKSAAGAALATVQADLLRDRRRHRELGC